MYGGLRGRRILVTRPKTQGGRLNQAITTLGGEVLWIPAIETVAEPLDDDSKALLHSLDSFNWVAFTSENALSYFLDLLVEEGLALSRSISVAAVGEATARACQARDLRVHARPEVFTGAALGELLASEFRPAKLLLPRSVGGRQELANRLKVAGWDVVPLTCYRTRPAMVTPEQIWSIEKGIDVAVFASPSAVQALWSALPETARLVLRGALCLPIGPTTAKAIAEVGLEPAPPPAESTTDGIVRELQRHFSG